MSKDWTGDNESAFRMLGASNHTDEEREPNDYYATDPIALDFLLQVEKFNDNVWECACGERHLSNVLEDYLYNVRSSDIIDRCGNEVYDFLQADNTTWDGDIITNPPYKYATEFVYKALDIIPEGNRCAMLLRLQFLEGKERKKLFQRHPPKIVYAFSGRVSCAKNGDFKSMKNGAVAYAWFVWEKGYKGDTILKWLN